MKRNNVEATYRMYYIAVTILMLCIAIAYKQGFFVVLLYALCMCLLHVVENKKRRSQMRRLSTYLQQIYQGQETFDIRDYCEGDLSILKSDLYKITHVLKQQKELLQKDKTFLADSLSDISHQIKTPLTSMLVVSDLLNQDIPEEKRKEFINVMKTQLKRIEWLVSSLLKMSKIDANTIQFHRSQTPLQSILEKSIEPFQIIMELKGQTLTIEGDASIQINADKGWLSEAFTNIIKNGIEHSGELGKLHITYTQSPLHTRVWIQDEGLGIASEDIPHVFERFYKGQNASNGSVGIGLALARSILIHHNATIEVVSEEGVGSTFIITFFK